jgi:copper chaperone
MTTIFSVPGMSCGHCTAAIEEAIRSLDDAATVRCDLGAKTVTVESGASRDALMAKLAAEGYRATLQG